MRAARAVTDVLFLLIHEASPSSLAPLHEWRVFAMRRPPIVPAAAGSPFRPFSLRGRGLRDAQGHGGGGGPTKA